MKLLGIDPGWRSGAAALFDNGRPTAVWRLPYNRKEKSPDFGKIADQIANSKATVAGVEWVHSMPLQGVASTFSFAQGYGFILGVLEANGIEIISVPPKKWRKALGVKSDKGESVKWVQQNFPDVDLMPGRLRTFNHNLADAVCIGYYALTKFMFEEFGKNIDRH